MDDQAYVPPGRPFLGPGSIPGLGTALGGGVLGSRCGTTGSLWGLGIPDLLSASCFTPDPNFPSGPDFRVTAGADHLSGHFLWQSLLGGGSPLLSAPPCNCHWPSPTGPALWGSPLRAGLAGEDRRAEPAHTLLLPPLYTSSAERDTHCL